MTYSKDEDGNILEEFDEYYVSIASKINNESSEEEIAENNEMLQQYLEELEQKLKNSRTE